MLPATAPTLNMQPSVSSPPSHYSLAVLALLASVALLVCGYLALAAKGGIFGATPALNLNLGEATVVQGESLRRGALWAPTADAQGVLIIRLSDRTVDTALFPSIRIGALADTPPMAVRLLWRQAEGARTTFAKTIAWQHSGYERVVLNADPQWRGQIAGLAIAFKLQPHAAVLFRSATLQSDTGRSVLSQVVGDWLETEPWGLYSVNYLLGGAPNPRVPLLPAVFAVAVVAFWLYRTLARRKGIAPSLAVGAAFAIGAWVVADVRWQLNLLSNLDRAAEMYAGKTLDEKHRSAEDGNIYRIAETIRKGLPAGVTKVTLVSDLADSELFLGKLRYYLFPLWLHPKPDTLEPQAVLAIIQSTHFKLDPAAGTLELDDGRSARVATLVDDPMLKLVRLR